MDDSFSEHKEPEEIFLPLSSKRYAEFYSIEMDDFTEDIEFYKAHCKEGSKILELGCGTGRISNALTSSGRLLTGLDLSLDMLRQAKKPATNAPSYLCMDMTQMTFREYFDHILIPYNTLNLLQEKALITRCLIQAHRYLASEGSLLLQLHIPDQDLIQMNGRKRFQFQMFSLPHHPGKLIKETLRHYDIDTQMIHLEERYRVRPTDNNASREDFNHTLKLAGFSADQWIRLLKECGFQNLTLFGDYDSRTFQTNNDTVLLVKATSS
ncbi:MAG: class I SAM-dependent methyltransferase [Desulfocapsa sp.]|nr:class I SAM-dependent methyltransferase [Desulfocapsa sp.]